jgi:hypothetical protein
MLVAEDRFDGLQAERCAAAINQGLEYLFHLPADLEQQVAAVFDLGVRILISDPPRCCSSKSNPKHKQVE